MDLTGLMIILLLLLALQGSAETHSLEYQYTALTPQYTGFPEFTAVGLLDGKQFMSYSSSNKMLIPENWIKNSKSENYWKSEEQTMREHHVYFNIIFTKIKSQFNHSRGHTLQRMYGCESDGGITRRYDQYGFDGEDFISLDLKTGTWIAVNTQAEILKHDWESTGHAKFWKSFLEHECIDLLNRLVNYGRETVERKVRPETSLFQKEASSPEVVCHATGFYSKALLISWKKDGEDVYEDVDLRETLPNQDGTFQKRSILKVSAEELQKHTYTCVIEHSSLEKDLVLPVSERRILRDGGSGGRLIGIITGIIVALVVLVAVVVAVIVVCKKKNCGFKHVPPRASSDGEDMKMNELNGHCSNQNNINTSEQTPPYCRNVLLDQTEDGDLKS